MKKFKFTLQTVHDVREMRRENESLLLTRLQNEAEIAEEQIRQIEQMRLDAIEKYTFRLQKGEQINAFELELNSNHISALDRQKIKALEILEQKKQACEKQSRAVADAVRAVKITGRLRENQAQKHKLEADRQEQNSIDELVSANFARERMEK